MSLMFFGCASAAPPAPAPEAKTESGTKSPLPPPLAAPAPAAPSESGIALKTVDTSPAAKALEERAAIEAALVFGSPSSIARAFELISQVTALKSEEARSLAWIGAKMGIAVYPDTAASFVPADLRGSAEIPSDRLARTAADVLAGRAAEVPAQDAGKPLAEVLPALAVFRSDSRETARRALEALQRFERLGANSIFPSLIRALEAERRLAYAEALEGYQAVIAGAADCWPASLGAARTLLELKRPEEAATILDGLLKSIGETATLRKPLAQALYEADRFAEAESATARVLRDDPLDSRFMLMRAHILVRARSYQQALPLLDAYGTVDPSNRLFLLLRTISSEGLRNKDDALKWARRGLSAWPDDPELLCAAARILFSLPPSVPGGPEAAKEEARGFAVRAAEMVNTIPANETAAVGTAAAAGSAEVPISALEKRARNQAGAEAARLLVVDAVSRYDWAKATLYLNLARKAPGAEDRALVALVLRKSGDGAAALEHAAAWYADSPTSEAAIEAYIRALVLAKDEKTALDLIPRVLTGKATPGLRSTIAFLQSLLQKNEEVALGFLRSALVENAENAEALAAVYDIYYKRSDFQKARFYLKQALALQPADPDILRRARELEAATP